MPTNPNNAIGTPAAYSGRTSVNAFNDVLQLLKKGVVSGWDCQPAGNMVVELGGTSGARDVAIAEDNAGHRVTINNISESPVEVELPAASTTSTYYYYIVAYVDNPPQGESTVVDNPAACGIIPVAGSAAETYPTDSVIRAAITDDGGVGTTAYYVVLRCIEVPSGTTTLTEDNIKSTEYNDMATVAPSGVVTSDNIDFTTLNSGLISSANGSSCFFYSEGFALNQSTGNWRGIDYRTYINYLGDLATVSAGTYDPDSATKGGPITLSSSFPEGLYLLTWSFQADANGSSRIPFRGLIERDGSTMFASGDVSCGLTGGASSVSITFWLKPGDIIYSQIYVGGGGTANFRHWLYLSRIF